MENLKKRAEKEDPFEIRVIKFNDLEKLGEALQDFYSELEKRGIDNLEDLEELPEIENYEKIDEVSNLMKKMFPDLIGVDPLPQPLIPKFAISNNEKEAAINYLADNVPRVLFKKILDKIQREGPKWWIKIHQGFGTDVRNALREGGFNWDDSMLDELWYKLIEEATRRVFVKKKR